MTVLGSFIRFTDVYVLRVELQGGIFFRVEGDFYKQYSFGGIAVLLASLIILIIRRSIFSKVSHKLQSTLIIIGTTVSVIIGSSLALIIPSIFGLYTLYPLTGLVAIIMAGSFFYAIITYHMFDISTGFFIV